MKTNYNKKGSYDSPDDYVEVIIKQETDEFKEFTGKWCTPLEFEEVLKLMSARKIKKVEA